MQRAPSATSLIGPIASTSTAPLLGNRVASEVRRTHGAERSRRPAGSADPKDKTRSIGAEGQKLPSCIFRNISPQLVVSPEDSYSLESSGVQGTPKRGPGPQGPTIIKEGRGHN